MTLSRIFQCNLALPMIMVVAFVVALASVRADAQTTSQSNNSGQVEEVELRDGWAIIPTPHNYKTLITRLDTAVSSHNMAVVTRASATVGARKALNKEIPGNMVVGVFHPRFAVRMLDASNPAGIEAPIRFYVTENKDGTATLSYKEPRFVFEPYFGEQDDALMVMARELDEIFAAIAEEATAAE